MRKEILDASRLHFKAHIEKHRIEQKSPKIEDLDETFRLS